MSSLILAEAKQLAWLLFVPQSDFCLISHGAAKCVQSKRGHGVALTLLHGALVPGWSPGVEVLLEGFPKPKCFEQQHQRGCVEADLMTPQVYDSGLTGLPKDSAKKKLFSSFHFH